MDNPVSMEDGYTYTNSEKKTSWTIMVYIAADSSLANFAVESLKQLNQAASASGTGDTAELIVAAQFSIDAPGGQMIKRYVFDGSVKPNLKAYEKPPLDARNHPLLSEREALQSFLEWVYKGEDCKPTDHYALILWSHGPELFLQPPLGGTAGDSASLYLTPGDLRDALINASEFRLNKRKLEIIGFDACSMSMLEVAYEIRDLAKLMIASQEEVPDASFPYSSMVQIFRQQGADVGLLLDSFDAQDGGSNRKSISRNALAASQQRAHDGLKNGVERYLNAYQDYIVGKPTGMNPVTLTVLNLGRCGELMGAVGRLACALLRTKDSELPRRLIQARRNSQDYAGGLYVDLHEFSASLYDQLNKANEAYKWEAIKSECLNIQNLLRPPSLPGASSAAPSTSSPGSFILINGAVTETGDPLINEKNTTANHGISIYLPYLTNRQFDDTVNRPLVKGGRGTNGGKGIPNSLNAAAGDYLMSTLQSLILATESYYGDLSLATDTTWYDFITTQWTTAINQTDPDPAFRYSRRQSDINTAASESTLRRIATMCGTSA